MNYITSTQLRTKTSEFIEMLIAGKSIDLIHRSQKIGTIVLEPVSQQRTNHARLAKNIKTLKLPYLTHRQMQKNYDDYISQKYG